MTTAETKTTRPESYLVADCGSTQTIVLLFDVVDDAYRLIGRAEAPTTIIAPWSDMSIGLIEAINRLSEMIGRQLLNQQKLIMPERDNRVGVDQFLMVVSAAPALRTILVGLSDDISLSSARRVLQTVYAQEIDTFYLGDGRTEEQQVAAIMEKQPDLIFLTGGTDGGADQRLLRYAQTVSLGVKMLSQARRVPVLYAGNSKQREVVRTMLGDAPFHVANNIRPSLETEQLDDALRLMGELYETLKIRELPGLMQVQKWSQKTAVPTARAFAIMVQYFAALQKGHVLGVDLGVDGTTLAAASPEHVHLTIRPDLGMGHTIAQLLRHSHLKNIANWLDEEIPLAEIQDFIYHKSLHPQTISTSEPDLKLEQAVAREMLQQAAANSPVSGYAGQSDPFTFRLLLARGTALSQIPRPGQLIHLLLDGLQPLGLFAVAVDRYDVLPALGALAAHQPLPVVQTLATKVLLELGWVVVPVGRAQAGQEVLHVRIESEQHKVYEGDVEYGAMEVFVLEAGRSKVTLQPARRFDIGFGPGKGATVTLTGGALGLVVDARGRPLPFPADPESRRALIQQWAI